MRAVVSSDARLKVATRAGMVLSCGCGLGRLNRQAWALRDFAVVRCFACCRLALHAKVDLALFDVNLEYSPLRRKAAMQRMVERAIRTDGWSARVGLPLVGLLRSAWASPHGSRTWTEAGAEGAEEPPTIPKAFLRTPTRCAPRTVQTRKGNPTTTTATTTMAPARTHAMRARAHTHTPTPDPHTSTSHGPRALACAKTAVSLPV
jgi:hypothetical protein